MFGIGKSIKTENTFVVDKGWGQGWGGSWEKMGNDCQWESDVF